MKYDGFKVGQTIRNLWESNNLSLEEFAFRFNKSKVNGWTPCERHDAKLRYAKVMINAAKCFWNRRIIFRIM